MQHLVLYTVCSYCNIHELHVPAGACILVTSVSPIDVPPIQRVLKHCGAYIHIYIHCFPQKHSQTGWVDVT